MDYIAKKYTISYAAGPEYSADDAALLHSNGGAGDVDWVTPHSYHKLPLFRRSSGFLGWGRASWGNFNWGRGERRGLLGWGNLPWGNFPWADGAGFVQTETILAAAGTWQFGLAISDVAGNAHVGTPVIRTELIRLTPKAPPALSKVSYDGGTGVLILDTNV